MVRALFIALLVTPLGAQTPASVRTQKLPESTVYRGATHVDQTGNVYVSGLTGQVSAGAVDTNPARECRGAMTKFQNPCFDIYITKSNETGDKIFTAALGSPHADFPGPIALDGAGYIYVTGTAGLGFPTTPGAAFPSAEAVAPFIAKLSPDASQLIYVTYLPPDLSSVFEVAADAHGNAFITGTTQEGKSYVSKLTADGTSFLHTTFLTTARNWQFSFSVNQTGEVFAAGYTENPEKPDSLLVKLDPAGNLVFSLPFGGSGTDEPQVVRFDPSGNLYVAGWTSSPDLPTTPGSLQPQPLVPASLPALTIGFLAKLTPSGEMVYLTYIPTPRSGIGALNVSSGEAYVAGFATPGFPITTSAPQPCARPEQNSFVAHLDAKGALLDATFFQNGDRPSFAVALGSPRDGSILLVSNRDSAYFVSRIRFGDPGWQSPPCIANDVLHSATLWHTDVVAPAQFVTLMGYGIGPATPSINPPDVQVFFDGEPARVIYADSRQVNTQAPLSIAGQETTQISLDYNGTTFGPIQATVGLAATGLFRIQPNVSPQALAVHLDGTFNSPSNPAPAGSYVILYGNGFGPTTPACQPGELNHYGPSDLAPGLTISIRADGLAYQPEVVYAGGAPTLPCGVAQINIRLHPDTPSGAYRLESRAPGTPTYGTVTIYVK